jgi:CubicO group peptidase (beta-lactamase class C family)
LDAPADPYLPPPHGAPWRRLEPREAGCDPAALADAVAFAAANETKWPRDVRAVIEGGWFESPPDNAILGEVRPRGAPCGVVLRGGAIVAEWGDTARPDMTFSVAKSYLGLLAGLAEADGLIADLDEPVGRTVRDGGFDSAQNRDVTWRHFLQLTSEWEGVLWDKSDAIDRDRDLAPPERRRPKGPPRRLLPPGSHFEYNDVRVNRLSLALLRRFRRPLPEVFRERIMDPIGASPDWEWHGYRNSWVEIDGRRMPSVSGGGHWGGGVFIGARDQARVGHLVLRRGRWGERRLLPADWIERSASPSPRNPQYGFLWWLNRDRRQCPSASPESVFFKGAGGNVTWIDPRHDLVAVLRWTDPAALDGFAARIAAALGG